MKFEKDDDGKIKQIPETLYERFIVLDDMEISDMDFASLYPTTMRDFNDKKLKRDLRKRKLQQIYEKEKESI